MMLARAASFSTIPTYKRVSRWTLSGSQGDLRVTRFVSGLCGLASTAPPSSSQSLVQDLLCPLPLHGRVTSLCGRSTRPSQIAVTIDSSSIVDLVRVRIARVWWVFFPEYVGFFPGNIFVHSCALHCIHYQIIHIHSSASMIVA